MQLRIGTSVISTLLIPASLSVPVTFTMVLTLGGSDSVTVNAIGAGTAGVVYLAQIIATRNR